MDAALAAAIGGPAVGIAAIAAGVIQSKGQRKHERDLAQGDRLFDARATAYEEMLRLMQRAVIVIERTHPLVGPLPAPPPEPTDEEWLGMSARMAAIGSETVEAAYGTLALRAREFHAEAMVYSTARAQHAETIAMRRAMDDARTTARVALGELEHAVRDELSSL